jgi:hypothetical protein
MSNQEQKPQPSNSVIIGSFSIRSDINCPESPYITQ